MSDIEGMVEVTERDIWIAMLVPGEYKKVDGKYYIKPGMLDGCIDESYYKYLDKRDRLKGD